MKTTILLISDSDKQFWELAKEYTKRLGKKATIVQLKPIKHGTTSEIVKKETSLLIKHLEKYKNSYHILLAHTWESLSSEKFSKNLYKHDHCVFVIWWPFWVNETLLMPHINQSISFWKQTMPHGLVKIVLLEQIWRWRTIEVGKKYHY